MSAATTFQYRVERTEYAEIVVDLAALRASDWWPDRQNFDTDEEFVTHVLWEIGVQDLTYDGDFITVGDKDTDEDIRFLAAAASSEGTPGETQP